MSSPNEVIADPQVEANGYMPRVPNHPTARLSSAPMQFDGAGLEIRRRAPEIGEHTDEVLREVGVDRGEIDRLRAERSCERGRGRPVRTPVGAPQMIWAVGLNYRAHAAETGRPLPEFPTLFVKSPRSVIGPDEPIVVPPHVAEPDYEGELAVVIGTRCRDVAEADALDCVAGLTIAHDVSHAITST